MASPALPNFNPARLRSYILRLPLFTRICMVAILVFWITELQTVWSVEQWGALIPSEIGFGTMYRLNTYPFIHLNLLHALCNILALTPLMERYEAEHGTLMTVAMFMGPLATLPAALYLLIEHVILRGNAAVMGASVWVFLLLAVESIKTYKTNPHFELGPYKVPTWTTPLALAVILAVLVSGTSFLGHLSAIAIGYLSGLGYLNFLAPPEKVLRWIESKLNLLGRLPHYVSIDQKTYGRYGVLPSSNPTLGNSAEHSVPLGYMGSTQRLGP